MNVAIILAGGSGERMGAMGIPKQFIDLYGKPVIIHTLEVFDLHLEIDEIVVVCREDYITQLKKWVRDFNLDKVKMILPEGKTRRESTFVGLSAIEAYADENMVVVIHDAVRPLVTPRIISENIRLAKEYGAVDTVIPAHDTIVKSMDGFIIDSMPVRNEIFLGQTPQSFMFNIIFNAHKKAIAEGRTETTDDCRIAMNMGQKIVFAEGDKLNFKLTSQGDLTLLKAIIKLGKIDYI